MRKKKKIEIKIGNLISRPVAKQGNLNLLLHKSIDHNSPSRWDQAQVSM